VNRSELLRALDEALTTVRRLIAAGVQTSRGAPATAELERLTAELTRRRAEVAAGGELEREWASATVRWVASWLPDGELPLLARLGAVVRAAAAGKLGRPASP
jgi:hypothetical protein